MILHRYLEAMDFFIKKHEHMYFLYHLSEVNMLLISHYAVNVFECLSIFVSIQYRARTYALYVVEYVWIYIYI